MKPTDLAGTAGDLDPWLLEMVVAHGVDGVVVTGLDGRVRFVNDQASSLLDLPAATALRKPFPYALISGDIQRLQLQEPDGRPRVIEMRTIALPDAMGGLYLVYLRDVTDLSRDEERVRALSFVDELTGLYNLPGFLTFTDQQLRAAARRLGQMVLILIDVDGMGEINRSDGQPAGDRLLRALAEILRATFRLSDVVGRVGGDAFAVLAVEAASLSADRLEERLRARIELFNREREGNPLRVSIGVARFDSAREIDAATLLEHARDQLQRRRRRRRLTQLPPSAHPSTPSDTPVERAGSLPLLARRIGWRSDARDEQDPR